MAALLSWNREGAGSLFERIQGKNSGSSLDSQIQDLVLSVKDHLSNVLNTRPGSCQSAISLGVTDLNDATMDASDLKSSVQMAIKNCIETFEPRVSHVHVETSANTEDPLTLNFQVSAYIQLDSMEKVVAFSIQLDSQRHYRLD